MPGNQSQGLEKVQQGLKLLMEALSSLPIGSDISHEVMQAATKIGKHLPQGGTGGDPQAGIQTLVQAARQMRQQPQEAAALQQMMGGGGASPPGMPPGGPQPGE